ncbi:hypothetical protein FQN54_003729 [Arachnomyces sp. PD_36]|nr:hypothetical protein FQN54_003729 [Arachnomyces sp. PD_36]
MRFLNTATLQLEDVPDSELGPKYPQNKYVTLSHRWGAAKDEVSYADINESRDFKSKKGYPKLKGFCDLAASQGYRYGWDDTCCINKVDLSELSEAISSMYRWYEECDLCIIYLEDVGPGRKSMMESTWFDRGWTLQELIGPRKAAFYDYNWHLLGTKSDLLEDLSTKTGIPIGILNHDVSLSSYSIAQRMSWAANRRTTKVEDRAYSLLGILDVNMPLIYGEREGGFKRLQQAIVQRYKDESIFAWSMKKGDTVTGLYAPSPDFFAQCSDVISARGSPGFTENNGEISFSLKTIPHSMETYYALLNCTRKSSPDSRIAIAISRTSEKNDDEYIRVAGEYQGGTSLVKYSDCDRFKTRVVRVSVEPTKRPLNRVHGFWLRSVRPPGHDTCQIRVLSKGNHKADSDKVYMESKDWGSAGIISMEPKLSKYGRYPAKNRDREPRIRWLKLGFDEDFNPMLLLANGHDPAKPTSAQFRCDGELFNQAIAWGPTSQPHKDIFDNHWIHCQERVPGKWYKGPEGISVLKVDRKEGVSGTVDDLNVRVDIKLVSDVSPDSTHLRKSDGGLRQIWAVDIADAGNRNVQEYSSDQQQEDAGGRTIFTAGCCGLQWTVARREKKLEPRLVDLAHQ